MEYCYRIEKQSSDKETNLAILNSLCLMIFIISIYYVCKCGFLSSNWKPKKYPCWECSGEGIIRDAPFSVYQCCTCNGKGMIKS